MRFGGTAKANMKPVADGFSRNAEHCPDLRLGHQRGPEQLTSPHPASPDGAARQIQRGSSRARKSS